MKDFACPECGCTEVDPKQEYILDGDGFPTDNYDFNPECKSCGHPFSEAAWRSEKVIFT